MSDVEHTTSVDTLSRNLIEARHAAAELGQPFIGYLIDMALAETKATGRVAAKRLRAAGLGARRHAAAASAQS